ncbi:uncharacterized protein LOC132825675 isoform X1 [Hemiscyllium ocellatum]|uniref:uncharacterized protein LOC132825675 isoform X1 n=2 Tax=Hemiscyllium ocellatum TaxID=170820 RepID=UPI00296612BA|nr:uncharacterized protein LOC132825675 isoform X1 [Hemiscyllium ocellatum]
MEDQYLEQQNSLGERLYNAIFPQYPKMAIKLTGMLLELPVPVLDQMIQDDKLLSAGLQKAFNTLQNSTEKCQSINKCLPRGEQDDTDSDSTDSLGDQLYDLVDVHNTGHSEKITGMLLEMGRKEVKKLVNDLDLLEQKIHIAQEALELKMPNERKMSNNSDFDDVRENLGEKIFEQVEKIDPQNCAYITGMLLELEPSAIQVLLTDRLALHAAVQKAQAVLSQSATQNPELVNSEDGSDLDSETEQIGEELYCYINKTKYSEHASRITGMLLEIPHNHLTELLKSPEELNEKIKTAASALEDD